MRSNHQVTTPAAKLSVAQAGARLPKRTWQRMRTGAGQKGVRDYDWAMIEVTADDTLGGTTTTRERPSCWSAGTATPTPSLLPLLPPGPVTLARLVSLVCRR
ncbi:hypothetical protein ABZ468_45780 [Streptomyces sp. NPDC005708]|uniref:hypothetical protein n=1 Tax=Streptomyces sp. NPDC005708 TaxID=3154564 RepID=UPI0033C4411B